jgi:membrane protease subunit (stomatin/prohibitin family)
MFTGRRWGTRQPVIVSFEDVGSVPIRVFGTFSFSTTDAQKFLLNLVGTKSTFSVSDLEEFIQSQLLELLPKALLKVRRLEQMSTMLNEVSVSLEQLTNHELTEIGLQCRKLQIVSALPTDEIIQALEAKRAMQVLGSQKEYLLYKAANSLEGSGASGSDPVQMMMALMLGKGIGSSPDPSMARSVASGASGAGCSGCGAAPTAGAVFCSNCGQRLRV